MMAMDLGKVKSGRRKIKLKSILQVLYETYDLLLQIRMNLHPVQVKNLQDEF